MHVYLGLFLAGLLATALLTPGVMWFARKIGAVDRGGYRKVYRGEMPLLGGLSIAVPLTFFSLCVAVLGSLVVANWRWVWFHYEAHFNTLFSFATERGDWLLLAVGGLGIVALGLVDDTRGMRARWKLLGQVVVAVYVCFTGHVFTSLSLPLVGTLEFGPMVGALLTVFWIVGLINAFNLIDGIDGLASGVALIGAGALVVLGLLQGNVFVASAGALLAGCLLGFLFYNFPPARIFLGDTGSMFLGYVLAILALVGTQKSEAAVILLAPILALGLPMFEVAVSMLRRYIRGVPVFTGDDHHTHHRLLRKGYSQPRVVLTLYGTTLLLATAAVMSAVIPETSAFVWTPYAVYIGTLLGIAWIADYLRPAAFTHTLERRQRNRLFQALGRYASLRFAAGSSPQRTQLLIDLCRHELGLRYLEVRMAGGQHLMRSSDESMHETDGVLPEELLVKSAGGQDIVIAYQFAQPPDSERHQDVCVCLAAIFDGMKVVPGALTAHPPNGEPAP
jgi:UDP-GlcNAc:undecaprenyl-phosphate GlcNAc-1-phosphate transferase